MSSWPIDIYDQSSKLLSKIKSYYVKEPGTSVLFPTIAVAQ